MCERENENPMCACIECLVLYLHIPDDPSETLKINVKWLLTTSTFIYFNAVCSCVITISYSYRIRP